MSQLTLCVEQKLNKVQDRVEMLEQDQAKSKNAIKGMNDGLQALNTIVEASETAGDRITAMINGRIYKINYRTRRVINGARIFASLA